ncbi:MAG: glycosyltransferase [Bryobacterales bacterium]|nr:glycosyltransferase [Bryobacterales bacterium]
MFSVVVPIYNHAAFIAQAVRSAQQSSLVGEILLVDDGSSDGSADIAAALAAAGADGLRNIARVGNIATNGGNRGAPYRLNQLVELAECEWVAVLNSDDLFLPGRFEAIAASPEFSSSDFIFGNVLFVDQRGALTGAKRGPFDFGLSSPPSMQQLSELLALENYIVTTSNMIFRKTLHARAGGFADLRYVHDWDFALRALAMARPLYVPRFLTAYRRHARNTILENEAKFKSERKIMLERYSRDFPATLPHARASI